MADEPIPFGACEPPPSLPAGARLATVWHRIRSGEDPLAFGAVVVVLALAAGLLWFWAGTRHGSVAAASPSSGRSGAADPSRPGRSPAAGAPDTPGDAPGPGSTTTGPAVAVHVAGAVLHPGLYRLPAGSRVADAIASAGGRLPRADLDRLNLAARLGDGQKVFVVRRGETAPPDVAGGGGADVAGGWAGAGEGVVPAEPIDLNTAGLAALDSLPGIGPATARAILEERARRGGFRSTRDLLRVPGIGDGRFARLKDRVRV
jgi:competence protein ComEA